MNIKIAKHCGFCYGVKRAVELAQKSIQTNQHVATYGPLIHNPQTIERLASLGIGCNAALSEFKSGDTVIFRSHGAEPGDYALAQKMELNILDATCPNVLNAQKKAKELTEAGYQTIIIGEKQHPEVKSIKAWAGKDALVIENIEDISLVPIAAKYGIIIQTTFELAKFDEILLKLKEARTGEYRVEKTICNATSERQAAAKVLAHESEVVFVIGGHNSANTRHLFELVQKDCEHVYQIETAEEILPEMIGQYKNIGITAGASTPDWIIKEAIQTMEEMETMESLLEKESMHLHLGMKVDATIVQVTKDGVVVDFSYQSEGIIPFEKWGRDATRESVMAEYKTGDIIVAKVIASEDQDGFVTLSKLALEAELAWTKLAELVKTQKTFMVTGLKAVKGGLRVLTEGVEGFIPASHLELRRIEDMTVYEGKELEAEVIEFDVQGRRPKFVLSRRNLLKVAKEAADKAYQEERAARMLAAKEEREERLQAMNEAKAIAEANALAELSEGVVVKGIVKNIVDFGMFVEIKGSLQGLVHKTQISWDRTKAAADLFKTGDEVEVKVIKIDPETKKVGLSIKALTEDPWQVEAAALKEGTIVECQIKRFLDFGAIAKISDAVEGMIHVSEMAEERVKSPEDVLSVDQIVKAKIIKLDRKAKKIGLSIIKAKKEEEEAEYGSFLKDAPKLSTDLSSQLAGIKTE